MPFVTCPIDDIELTIIRPLTKSVVEDVMKITGVDAEITWNDRLGIGNTYSKPLVGNGSDLKFRGSDKIGIDFPTVEDRNEGYEALASMQHQPSIFDHSELGIRIKPLMLPKTMTIDIEFVSNSLNKATRFLNRVRSSMIKKSFHNYHSVLYNYKIPDIYCAYLYNVYQLSHEKDTMTLSEWQSKYFTEGLIVRQNQAGKNSSLAVNANVTGVLGIATNVPSEIDSDRDSVTHTVHISYEVEFNVVYALYMEYQITICQQRIMEDIMTTLHTDRYPKVNTRRGTPDAQGPMVTLVGSYEWERIDLSEIFYDKYDTWHPNAKFSGTRATIMMFPIVIDRNYPRYIDSVHDLGEGVYWDALANIIMANREHVTTIDKYPLTLELYEVYSKTERLSIEISPEGVISALTPLYDCRRYYLRVAIETNWDNLYPMLDTIASSNPNTIRPGSTATGDMGVTYLGGRAISNASLYNLLSNYGALGFLLNILKPGHNVAINPSNGTVDIKSLRDEIKSINSTNSGYQTVLGSNRVHRISESSEVLAWQQTLMRRIQQTEIKTGRQ